jgi:Tfp pilus assembly protein PilP
MTTRSQHRAWRALLVLALCAAACGDDAGGAQGPGGQAPAPAPVAAVGSGSALTAFTKVEDVVPEGERGTIRQPFHERDFLDSNRDPFSSSALAAAGSNQGSNSTVVVKAVECKSKVIAANYSYADLKLVGIVAQGTQHKVLMMDPGNLGRIIGTGECVGKEKALVKEIAQNYVTFLITPEAGPGQGGSPRVEQYSVKLHDHDLDVTTPDTDLSQPTPESEGSPVLPSSGNQAPSGQPGLPVRPGPQPVVPAGPRPERP